MLWCSAGGILGVRAYKLHFEQELYSLVSYKKCYRFSSVKIFKCICLRYTVLSVRVSGCSTVCAQHDLVVPNKGRLNPVYNPEFALLSVDCN